MKQQKKEINLINAESNKNSKIKISNDNSRKGHIKSIPKVMILILERATSEMKLQYPISEIVEQVKDYHNSMIKNHGIIDGTKRFNSNRLYILQMIEGGRPLPLPFNAISAKHKFPSALFKMLDLYLISTDLKSPLRSRADRIIRSLFYINRLVADNDIIELGKITDTYPISDELQFEFRNFIRKWKVKVNYDNSHDLITEPTEKFVRNGPNGQPKWMTADIEAKALMETPSLWEPFCNICNLTGNQNLITFCTNLGRSKIGSSKTKSYLKKFKRAVRVRFVTSAKDKANKSRVVAISDYFTQILLTPLMEEIKSITNKYFPNFSDSLSHSYGFEQLKIHVREGIKSYDISSWTDAFPASLQKIVLDELFSPELASNWYKLVVECDWAVKGRNKPVRYGRGQGMGTAGSFDIAMLTDIFVLTYIYESRYGFTPKKGTFRKVGDDLWCYDPKGIIYDFYTKELGLEINLQKTKSVTPANKCAEYVSRNLNFGKDVSRISFNICRAVGKNIFDLPQLASHLEERDYHHSLFPIKEILSNSISSNKIKHYIRSFWVLTLLYPKNSGNKMLKRCLYSEYRDFIDMDPVCSSLKSEDELRSLRISFLTQNVQDILTKINQKMRHIFSNFIPGYECSTDLIEDNTKANSFKYKNIEKLSLAGVTSQFVLAKCYRLIKEFSQAIVDFDPNKKEDNQLSAPVRGPMIIITLSSEDLNLPRKIISLNNLERLFEKLSFIYENLTFVEHDVIAKHDKRQNRYVITCVHRMVGNLVYLPDLVEISDVSLNYDESPRFLALKEAKNSVDEAHNIMTIDYLPQDKSISGLPKAV